MKEISERETSLGPGPGPNTNCDKNTGMIPDSGTNQETNPNGKKVNSTTLKKHEIRVNYLQLLWS